VVGVPREIKPGEQRVALTPDGVAELVGHGIRVLVERGAGDGSALADDGFRAAGAELSDSARIWSEAGLVVKVKEPQPEELPLLHPGLALFTFLHLAAYPEVAGALLAERVTAFGYETVRRADGTMPLLAPMSEVAGRLATLAGGRFLERHAGGRGVLLGGATGVAPARVVVIGAGTVGANAARSALGVGAEVLLFDRDLDRLRALGPSLTGRITTLAANRGAVARAVASADLVIGAVLVPGARAPVVVTEAMVATMADGSVVVDCAIDQGGCVETSQETTHEDPVVEKHGVLHYAVGNIPAAVPHTSTYALTNATLPYVVALARHGASGAVDALPELAEGLNTATGSVVNPAVAGALGRAAVPVAEALGIDGPGAP